MKIEIDGKEYEFEGLPCDSVVIARPTQQLSKQAMQNFADNIALLAPSFRHHDITVIAANKDQVTFEVLKVKHENARC